MKGSYPLLTLMLSLIYFQTLSKQTCNGLELQQLYLMKNYVKLARSCVLSKDLVHIVANHVNTCTAMDSNDTQYKGML